INPIFSFYSIFSDLGSFLLKNEVKFAFLNFKSFGDGMLLIHSIVANLTHHLITTRMLIKKFDRVYYSGYIP
ncbi:MAG TPA: hypothetical protein VL854_05955, partial [Nitrososphaeraceae archaeon]|nr:hypothetical protein [Nitrososphaeraceae archaeon]